MNRRPVFSGEGDYTAFLEALGELTAELFKSAVQTADRNGGDDRQECLSSGERRKLHVRPENRKGGCAMHHECPSLVTCIFNRETVASSSVRDDPPDRTWMFRNRCVACLHTSQ